MKVNRKKPIRQFQPLAKASTPTTSAIDLRMLLQERELAPFEPAQSSVPSPISTP